MSHKCGRASLEKRLDFSKKQSTTDQKRCSLFTVSTDSKYFDHSCKIEQYKTKRLKTHKERCQRRGGQKEAGKTKSCHQHCHCQSSKDTTFLQNCCNSCHWTSRSCTPILSAVPVAQEPSIITESRLIGHHGLFNHKVKSIDIERLLSNQSKLELSRQNVTEENNNTSNLSSGTHIPALLSSDGLLSAGADANTYDDEDVRPFRKKTSPVSQETEVKNLQGSDITTGQRPPQQLDPLSGRFKIIPSSKHILHSEETTMTNPQKYNKSEKKGQLPPSDGSDSVTSLNRKQDGHKITDLEQPHKNQDHQTRADGLKPGPLQLFNSPTAESLDMQHRKQDPENVAKVVSAVAEHLSGSLPLPVLKHKNLSAKRRKLLLKSLQKSHGPWLKANLEMHQCVGYDVNPTQATLDQEQIVMEEDQVLLPETSVPTTGSRHFSWESTPQPHWSLQQPKIAEDLTDPVEPSGCFFDDAFRPTVSHHFSMNFEPSGSAPSDLFALSPKFFQKEKAEFWQDFKSKSEESTFFDFFPKNFTSHTQREVREVTCELQTDHWDIQPFFYLQDGHSAEPAQFSEQENLFEPARNMFAPLLPTQFHPHSQSSHFHPFEQFSARPNFRSHHSDVRLYPPSHMLERSQTPPPSSFLSPGHWSFPPMRLY